MGGRLKEAFERLERRPGFSHRPQQRDYARCVLRALEEGGIALLEAGPGTGKTFGYLVPLLLALEKGERAVVATRTRALQEQLWEHDLPVILEELSLNLPVALLKGRENYLCLRRLEEARLRLRWGPFLEELLSWAEQTRTGDLDELVGPWRHPEGRGLLSEVRDTPLGCVGVACPFFGRCPSRRARERARRAALVVVNHALLAADLSLGGKVLGNWQYLVVDEAHGLPEALREAWSMELDPLAIPRLLGELGRGGLLPKEGELAVLGRRVARFHRGLWAALEPLVPQEAARYHEGLVEGVKGPARGLIEALSGLSQALSELGLPEEGEERAKAFSLEAARLAELVQALLWPEGGDYVYWWGRGPFGPALHASPVELAPLAREALWSRLRAGVLTSATLAVGRGAGHLIRELGIPKERAWFRHWPSPFSYEGVRAFALAGLPSPDDGAYPEALAGLIKGALKAVPCRALALFTSRKLLLATRAFLSGIPVLAQGVDGEREQLLAAFRSHPPPVVLLGLDSLWEGVDLPGEELELLFITRLPFPVPTDPVAQAEAARLAAQGKDPFWLLFLPRAVLKLRQGVGRLVRTPQDRGAIVIADVRAALRPYGERFLSELPVPAQVIAHPEELPSALRRLFPAG
ncbi:ATP-dependent DNA helicase [Candidatus Bipolaricaulota bacterium]|nr:ATP-dependent DNA helicase [Candidatus Bipolaricaulota bacterium]